LIIVKGFRGDGLRDSSEIAKFECDLKMSKFKEVKLVAQDSKSEWKSIAVA